MTSRTRSSASRRVLRRLLAASAVGALATMSAQTVLPEPAHATTETEGYLTLPDGTRLRYTLVVPDGDGPFPTVLQYSGYNNGNNPKDGTFGKSVDQVLARDMAVIGVNLRGSGCSEGTFKPFGPEWAQDGVDVIDWIADQEWSDGNVAMVGVSYPAITSTITAVQKPEHLKAVIANVPVIDLYPDVAYPGGIFNQTFAGAWTAIQKYGTFFGFQETAEGDLECPQRLPTQNDPNDLTGVQAASNPYKDSLDRYTDFLQPEHLAEIEVPSLVYTAWQDEQLGSRAMYAYEHLDPDNSWIVASNGDHIGFSGSEWYREHMVDFLDHFLRGGTAEEWDAPRVQIPHEISDVDASFTDMHTSDVYPLPTITERLYVGTDNAFTLDAPTADAGALTFNHPQPAPNVFVGIDTNIGFNPVVYNETYKVPVAPGGNAFFTTPVLEEDVLFHGPASLDLWLSSTHTDADLQVTLTEVRPDGNELYVQRGWLRASHRKLDEAKSTETRPFQTHLSTDAEDLVPGEVTPMRIELWPVHHAFRAGSALRVYVESPVGFTGFRQLQYDTTPAQFTLHVGPETPMSFAFGRLADTSSIVQDLPACDTLLNQPCRTAPGSVPAGTMSFGEGEPAPAPEPTEEPSPAPTPEPTEEPAPAPDENAEPVAGVDDLPATGGGAALAGLSLLAAATAVRRRS